MTVFFFVSAGLEGPFGIQQRPVPASNGAICALTFPENALPALTQPNITGLPSELNFRPHGIFISDDKLFVVSHNEPLAEENVVAFDIMDNCDARTTSDDSSSSHDSSSDDACQALPSLEFVAAFTSPQWTPVGSNLETWHLNNLVLADDDELLVAQLGPFNPSIGAVGQRSLRSCCFDDSFENPSATTSVVCEAISFPDAGLNGIAIDAANELVWVNDLLNMQLVKIRRDNGNHDVAGTIPLPSIVDDIQHVDGKIIGGSINAVLATDPSDLIGGLVVVEPDSTAATDSDSSEEDAMFTAAQAFELDPLFLLDLAQTTTLICQQPVQFLVSSAALQKDFLILGSFSFAGVVV